MYVVHLYAEAENEAPRNMQRMAGYVLECTTASGKTRTVENFAKYTGTYHAVVLGVIVDALKRINQSCELHIHTKDEYVLMAIDKNLHIWAGNGFRTAKGELVKNHFEWSRIWGLLNKHLIVAEQGPHAYYSWMVSEMKRNAGDSRNTE